MNSYNLVEIKENSYFTADVFVDKNFILCSNSTPITKSMIQAMVEWDIKTVYSDGHVKTKNAAGTVSLDEIQDATHEFAQESIEEQSSIQSVKFDESSGITDEKKMSIIQNVYDEYLNYINSVFRKYATDKKLVLSELSSNVKNLIQFVKDNKKYILRYHPESENFEKNYLINHAMRTTVFAIIIGLQMKLPSENLVELGIAGIIHEIGMLRLPPQIYLSERKLSSTEFNEIRKHTLLSYKILTEQKFPTSICKGVLEHHEKINGKGYPQNLSNAEISPYGKILAVACSYEAITAPRTYKTAESSYQGIIELIKNEGMQYDPNVLKALVMTLSFFPIGAYVYLSDGKVAQVYDTNPRNPRCPLVQVLTEKDEKGDYKIIQTSEEGIKIVRVMDKKEATDVINSIKTTH